VEKTLRLNLSYDAAASKALAAKFKEYKKYGISAGGIAVYGKTAYAITALDFSKRCFAFSAASLNDAAQTIEIDAPYPNILKNPSEEETRLLKNLGSEDFFSADVSDGIKARYYYLIREDYPQFSLG
jgi:hypothetical protein